MFEKKVIEYKMCILIFCTSFTWNISHFKRYYHKCKNVFEWSTRSSRLILINLNYLDTFSKKRKAAVPDIIKIRREVAEFLRAYGHT